MRRYKGNENSSIEIRRVEKIEDSEPKEKTQVADALLNLSQENRNYLKLIRPGSIPNYTFVIDNSENQNIPEQLISPDDKDVMVVNSKEYVELLENKGTLVSINQRLIDLNILGVEFRFSDSDKWRNKFSEINSKFFDYKDGKLLPTGKTISNELFLNFLKQLEIGPDQVFTYIQGGIKKERREEIFLQNGLKKISSDYYKGLLEGLENDLFQNLQARILLFHKDFIDKSIVRLEIPKPV